MNKKLIIAVVFAIVATAAGLRHPSKNVASTGNTSHSNDVTALTQQQRVADYLHQHHQLPSIYLSKAEAKKRGWDPARGDLCSSLGRAIGGDRFGNHEKLLPEAQGRRWFEADVNYQCGHRGSDRLLYSSDGLIYLTRDHYRHVERVY
ncbi:ribonuclease domain-containing protein [Pantoea sp. MBD-2R]|uniref:ribonuclease domain-containing protein n=1 Tax=Pantoea sp. MBD-2R TaxID=3141540 RepID=UPI003182DB62